MTIELNTYQRARLLEILDHNTAALRVIIAECERQHTDAQGVMHLVQAFHNAQRHAKSCPKPTLRDVLSMAASIEPKTKGQLRTTPITFTNGGSAAPASTVVDTINHLFDILAEHDDIDADEFCRTFESIHPFIDGNGRVAWLIRTWLTNTWDFPQRLPVYDHH